MTFAKHAHAKPLTLQSRTQLYIGGAVLYALHIPERFWPGEFNFIGHSHFLFHCCVVAAALVHYWNVAAGNDWRVSVLGNCTAFV